MGCAGVTTYNALRRTRALPGDRVAVLGVGGLGHLGVQFARAMGFETIAIARGRAKTEDARELGAHHYIDSTSGDVAEAMRALGGAAVVLATAGNSAAVAETVGGLLPQRRTDHHWRNRRPAADQSDTTDDPGCHHCRPSLRHGEGYRRGNAFRRFVGRSDVDRGAAVVAGRSRLRGDGTRSRTLPHRSHRLSRVGL
jgi:hypothetical protein